jgi:carbamoyltransferase
MDELDAAAFFWNPAIHLRSFNRRRAGRFRHHSEYLWNVPTHLFALAGGDWTVRRDDYTEQVFHGPGGPGFGPKRIYYVAHHLCHAAAAYYPSPFDEAAILTVDGYGETTSALLGRGKAGRIEVIKEIYFPHSLGAFYAAITQYLGFKPNNAEGKIMALASFEQPVYADEFRQLVQLKPDGEFELDLTYFDYYREAPRRYTRKFVRRFGPERQAETGPLERRHYEIAASAQLVLEEAMLHMARYLYGQTRCPNLVMAGGVVLNSVANERVMRETPFQACFLQPAAGDNGSSLGAALYVEHMIAGGAPRTEMVHDFLGPGYDEPALEKAFALAGVKPTRPDDIHEAVAERLARGRIVGWFQGRMEYGPRALGARSILADPRGADTKDRLNARVKRREPFRPFAPAVLLERCGDYFDSTQASPFMLRVYGTRPEWQQVVPAVVHVDGSARVQTVDRTANPDFYRLIETFGRHTGLPMLLNTSFNIRGEPIVCTPEDAMRCYFGADMDDLALGPFLLSK